MRSIKFDGGTVMSEDIVDKVLVVISVSVVRSSLNANFGRAQH